MSPPRWHIGHTSWFFETLLQTYQPGYRVYSEEFLYYFNSYYEGFGARIERGKRGTKSRPTVRATIAYRSRIDELMLEFLEKLPSHPEALTVNALVRLGLDHEMQHQDFWFMTSSTALRSIRRSCAATPRRQSSRGRAEVEGGLFFARLPSKSKVQSPKSKVFKLRFRFRQEKPAHQVSCRFCHRPCTITTRVFGIYADGGYRITLVVLRSWK